MNSLKGASFQQKAILVCKLCRVAVGSGRKSSEVFLQNSWKILVSKTKVCRLHRPLGPSASTERQATCFHRLLRGSRSVRVSKVSINYYYSSLVGQYSSEERGCVWHYRFICILDEGLAHIFLLAG